jgi:hypothetical protein
MVFGPNGLAIHVSNVRWSILVERSMIHIIGNPKLLTKKLDAKNWEDTK